MRKVDQKIIIVRRATRLAGLRQRHATVAQAEFLMEAAEDREILRKSPGAIPPRRAKAQYAFHDYKVEDQTYRDAIEILKKDLHGILPVQLLDREMLPTYLFGPQDIVVTIGQDGLVANTAKYAANLPIVAVNPDPKRFDGILLPFKVEQARPAVLRVMNGQAKMRRVTMAEAMLADGQRLRAFNDLFIGCRTHVSARYRIEFENHTEPHSSSGVLVSTGAGSTGWLSSIFNMASGLALATANTPRNAIKRPALTWEDPRLIFVAREPFASKSSAATIVSGTVIAGRELIIESHMPTGGVIFSDGIESDFLEFNSGAIVHITASKQHAMLVV